MKNILYGLLIFGLNFAGSQNSGGQTIEPNVLIIITDEQAWDALGSAGNRIIKTPNIDRLAAQGAIFTHAVTACPVCAPARTSILTGRLIEKTTIRLNADIKTNDCYYSTFDEILVKRGYSAEYHGKFHAPEHMARIYTNPPVNGKTDITRITKWELNYREFLAENIVKQPLKEGELYEKTFYGGCVPYKPNPLDRHYKYMPSGKLPDEKRKPWNRGQEGIHGVLDIPPQYTITAVQGKAALEALERLKDNKFTLTCSFHCPHPPIVPSEPYASMYKVGEMIPPVSGSDKRENSPYKVYIPENLYADKKLIKYMIANYYAFVTEVDDWVGKILEKLDELKLMDNTLIIFVSDHGEMLGAHGMRGKFCFYEESVRVPFIFHYPDKIKAGIRIDNPVSTLNIFATVLDYAGVNNIQSDGFSLKPLIEGEEPKYDFAVSEWSKYRKDVPSLMIRTRDWKLMTTSRQDGFDVEALYNLIKDPYELNNLLGTNPDRFKYAKKAEELQDKLVDYLKDVNYPLSDSVAIRKLVRDGL